MNALAKLSEKFFITILLTEEKGFITSHHFDNLLSLSRACQVHVVYAEHALGANITFDRFSEQKHIHFYTAQLKLHEPGYPSGENVAASLNRIRERFLQTKLPYFLIIDDRVSSLRSLLTKFDRAIAYLEITDPSWGGLGELYHRGSQTHKLNGIQKTPHVLEGCTVFKRPLIEKYRFTAIPGRLYVYSHELIDPFACHEYNFYNGHWTNGSGMENPRIKPAIVKVHR
jgi:hypothetical protein